MTEVNLSELLAPLKQRREELDEQEAEARARLTVIREEQMRLDRVLKAGGLMETRPKQTQKRERGERSPANRVSAERVEEVYDWLVKNVGAGQDFNAPGLLHDGFDLASRSSLQNALLVLNEQGRIRLDSTGPGERGVKNYKLVGG